MHAAEAEALQAGGSSPGGMASSHRQAVLLEEQEQVRTFPVCAMPMCHVMALRCSTDGDTEPLTTLTTTWTQTT